jgi:hypothetical protein
MESSYDDDESYIFELLEGHTYAPTDPDNGSECMNLPCNSVNIGLDDADTHLMDIARWEVECVMTNYMLRLLGTQYVTDAGNDLEAIFGCSVSGAHSAWDWQLRRSFCVPDTTFGVTVINNVIVHAESSAWHCYFVSDNPTG